MFSNLELNKVLRITLKQNELYTEIHLWMVSVSVITRHIKMNETSAELEMSNIHSSDREIKMIDDLSV